MTTTNTRQPDAIQSNALPAAQPPRKPALRLPRASLTPDATRWLAMEKYYIGKLPHWRPQAEARPAGERRAKLVELQFSRRPPTLGVIYVATSEDEHEEARGPPRDELGHEEEEDADKRRPAGSFVCQTVHLATLSLGGDNLAKFAPFKQIKLSRALAQAAQAIAPAATAKLGPAAEGARRRPVEIVDFDTNDVIQVDGSPTNEQQFAQSVCAILVSSGIVLVVSLIDCLVKYVLPVGGAPGELIGGAGRLGSFLQCRITLISTDHQLEPTSFCVHTLSDQRLWSHQLEPKVAAAGAELGKKLPTAGSLLEVQLVGEIAAQVDQASGAEASNCSRSKRFRAFHLIDSKSLILQLLDGTVQIFKNSRCVYSSDGATNALDCPLANRLQMAADQRQTLVVASRSVGDSLPVSLVINYLPGSLIVAHSLFLSAACGSSPAELRQQANLGSDERDSTSADSRTLARRTSNGKDPDELLPRAPDFELERCWSIDLNEIDSTRSLGDEAEGDGGGRSTRPPGCLCALQVTGGPTKTSRVWGPTHLLVTHRHHVLVFSFEHEVVMPFSVIYDRAFLHLGASSAMHLANDSREEPGRRQLQQQQQQQQQQTLPSNREFQLELTTKPRLVHNFKLIGTQTTDSLYNNLFLVAKVQLVSAVHSSQLGLVFSLSSEGDLLALKLTSSKLVQQKDNVYQQLLVSSIRQSSLLRDELERLERQNSVLRADIASLSEQTKLHTGATTAADFQDQRQHLLSNLERMVRIKLKPNERLDCLFDIELFWSSLVQIREVVVVSTLDSYIVCDDGDADSCGWPSGLTAAGDSRSSVRSIQVVNRQIDKDESELSTLSLQMGERLPTSPIRSTATIQFRRSSSNATARPRNMTLSLPICVADGQRGQVKAYFVLDSAASQFQHMAGKLELQHRDDQLLQHWLDDDEELDGQLEQTTHHRPARYCARQVQVNPLLSYRIAHEKHEATTAARELEIVCLEKPAEVNLFRWLAEECLQQTDEAMSCFEEHSSSDGTFELQLESTFTHCFLQCRCASGGEQLCLVSNDFRALELVGRQLLRRATDQSIKLKMQSSPPTPSELMHLIGLQRLNVIQINKFQSVCKSSGLDGGKILNNSKELVEELLESLMSELVAAEQSNIPSEFEATPNLLERSFRNDIEQLLLTTGTDQTITPADDELKTRPDDAKFKHLKHQLIGGYLVNALLDYDMLHNLRTNSKMVAKMHSRLGELLSAYQAHWLTSNEAFAKAIVSEWAQLQRERNRN